MQRHALISLGFVVSLGAGCGSPAPQQTAPPSNQSPKREIERILDTTLAPPAITAETGFTAEVLVPPGELYDPLQMVVHDGAVWLNDDGGENETRQKGSRILAIDDTGKVTTVVGLDRMLPVVGFDVAPAGFGQYGGQLFTLAQAQATSAGTSAPHIIQVVNPRTSDPPQTFCTLPPSARGNPGAAGLDARFGPPGSPFANQLFAITIRNATLYRITADGTCSPLASFDGPPWGRTSRFAFSADGSRILVAVSRSAQPQAAPRPANTPPAPPTGAIVAVAADGKVDEKPVYEGLLIDGLEVAPANFGAYGGQIFFTTSTGGGARPRRGNGSLYRLTADGTIHRVATGFDGFGGVAFVNGSIWITSINRDFIVGGGELPDGSIIRVRPAGAR